MSETLSGIPMQVPNSGERAISRLADRIAAMAPAALDLATVAKRIDPPPAPPDAPAPMLRPSPVVMAALAHTDAMTGRAAHQAPPRRRTRSLMGRLLEGYVGACSFIPYALVGLALRLVMARAVFLDGQSRVDGLRLPLDLYGFDLSVVVPMQVKAEMLAAFVTRHAALPPLPAAYLVSGAEFLLPIMLAVGLGTRFAALGLLIVTAMIQFHVLPQAWWSIHVFWASILMVLLALGPGLLSIDALIRQIWRRR